MKFCDKCDSKLLKTNEGLKCPKCDNYSPVKQNTYRATDPIPPTWEKFSGDGSFPFIPGQLYPKKEIWQTLEVSNMGGIRYNSLKNFLVIFLDAHEPLPKFKVTNNIYQDKYDKETGVYHYTGAGQVGDQTLTGRNYRLEKSKENNTKIHLFVQESFNGKHRYVGEVEVVKKTKEEQADRYGSKRNVYVFWLRPIQNIT